MIPRFSLVNEKVWLSAVAQHVVMHQRGRLSVSYCVCFSAPINYSRLIVSQPTLYCVTVFTILLDALNGCNLATAVTSFRIFQLLSS